MKIVLELFGASRDFNEKGHIDFEIQKPILIKEFRKVISNYLNEKFKGNDSFLQIVKNLDRFVIGYISPYPTKQPVVIEK